MKSHFWLHCLDMGLDAHRFTTKENVPEWYVLTLLHCRTDILWVTVACRYPRTTHNYRFSCKAMLARDYALLNLIFLSRIWQKLATAHSLAMPLPPSIIEFINYLQISFSFILSVFEVQFLTLIYRPCSIQQSFPCLYVDCFLKIEHYSFIPKVFEWQWNN